MDPERRFHDEITYWPPVTRDQFGATTFGPPVTFVGRWVEKLQDVYDSRGEIVQSAAQIHYPDTMANTVEFQGYMVKGISIGTDPTAVEGAYLIKDVREIPDLRGVRMQWVAVL